MINYPLIFYSLFIVSAIIALIYANLIFSYKRGWKSLSSKLPKLKSTTKASIVVACRNEEESIEGLLISLFSQSYPNDKYEIIIVDDFSTDSTIKILNNYKNKITLLHALSPGKKNAIKHGIENAIGELIITTDADCIVPHKWIESHVATYIEQNTYLQLAPVDFSETNLFEKILTLEFYSLIGSAGGSVSNGKAILSNAANMSFSKEIYNKLKKSLNNELPSGDDVFLLQELKKEYPDRISYIKLKDCIVTTKPPRTFTEFFNQRLRWASKNKHYTDRDIINVGFTVFSINILMFINLLLAIFEIEFILLFAVIFIIKSIPDYFLLSQVTSFFKKRGLLKYFFLVQLFYPIYVIVIGLSSLFIKYKWKGRRG